MCVTPERDCHLLNDDEDCAFEHGVAGVNVDRSNLAVAAGMDGVLHLHGLKDEDGVGSLDGVADLDGDGEDGAGEGAFT